MKTEWPQWAQSQCGSNRQGNKLLKPVPLAPLPKSPLVSVLVANFNYGPFLRDAIGSVLQQTYQNLEIVVCDDGSTDDSPRILKAYQSSEPRMVVLYQANRGQATALNAAFAKSRGQIVCFLDADDLFSIDKLQSVVDAFLATPQAGFVVHRMLRVNSSRKRLGKIPLLFDLPCGWRGRELNLVGPEMLPGLPPCSGLALHRSVAEVIFPIPSGLKTYADAAVQVLAPMTTPIVAIDRILGEYRVHGGNHGGKKRYGLSHLENFIAYENEIWTAWRKYLASIPGVETANFVLPPETAPSMMEYAHARFTGSPEFRRLYRLGMSSPFYGTQTALYRWYWKMSIFLPNWLFRISFAIVYGQLPAKDVIGRVLHAFRWIRQNLSASFGRSDEGAR